MVVVAYQPWLNSERRSNFERHSGRDRGERTRNLEIPRCAIAHLRSGPEPVIGRRRAPTRWDHPGTTKSVLPGENPVAPGLQPDDVADLKFPVAGRIDLDHGLTPGRRQRHFGALDRAEGSDMAHRAVERAAAGRPDLHVMAADEQFRCARPNAVRRDIQ